jgi:hypothetical protein
MLRIYQNVVQCKRRRIVCAYFTDSRMAVRQGMRVRPNAHNFQTELCQWIDVLDKLDSILAAGCRVQNAPSVKPDVASSGSRTSRQSDGVRTFDESHQWPLFDVDVAPNACDLRRRILAVLYFTALLYENTYSRHVYSSLEVREGVQKSIVSFSACHCAIGV